MDKAAFRGWVGNVYAILALTGTWRILEAYKPFAA